MGIDIEKVSFVEAEYVDFSERLTDNLAGLQRLLRRPGFGEWAGSLGAELEIYIVDAAGRPLHRNEEMLEIFAEFKYEALLQKDYLGENPLFECARNGNENIFNWFTGNNELFKARGMQNFKG